MLKSSGLNDFRHTRQAPALLGGLPGSGLALDCVLAAAAAAVALAAAAVLAASIVGVGSGSGTSEGRGDNLVTDGMMMMLEE